MKNTVTCEIIQDLIPLYADDVCSGSSRAFVQEHLAVCEDCRKVAESGNLPVEIPFLAQKKALRRFRKKMTRKNILIAVLAFLASACVLAGACYGLFVPEFVVPYSEDLLHAHIPIDSGIDVNINIGNYKQVHTWSITDEESGKTDVYLTVTQTLFTRLYTPEDKSDYLWRTNNDGCVDFHSGIYHPYSFGATDEDVQNIYYLEMPPEDILTMTDGITFDNYKTYRIWSAEQP
ncbi:MAG: hypothetical protein E7523_05540 [Ruminococcaceae bacterium]|nr:hypothetical protein [Oscillospiraceae bacterium]